MCKGKSGGEGRGSRDPFHFLMSLWGDLGDLELNAY